MDNITEINEVDTFDNLELAEQSAKVEMKKAQEDNAFEVADENDNDMQSAKRRNAVARHWAGTWNNPTMTADEFYQFLYDLWADGVLQYAVFQPEKGEKCGTQHFQFFWHFKKPRTYKWLKENMPNGAWFKPMISNPTRCRTYCTKPDTRVDDKFYEVGEFTTQGTRTDLKDIMSMIDDGATLDEVRQTYPVQHLLHRNKFEQLIQDNRAKEYMGKFREITVNYVWGSTGTGKTRHVYDKFGYGNVYRINNYDKGCWDSYNGETILVLDEFRSSFKIGDMLTMLEGHPQRLPARYSNKVACFEKIYIISNIPFTKQYTKIQVEEPETFRAFQRRISNIYNFDNLGEREKLLAGEPNTLKVEQGMIIIPDEDMPF